MSVARVAVLLLLSALLVAPSLGGAATGTTHDRVVDRAVATPTPAGPLLLLRDDAQWRIDVPAEVVVVVDARATAQSFFHLQHHRDNQAERDPSPPSTRALVLLPGPATWFVQLDPAGGAAFHAEVHFHGHVVDVDGAPAAFTLHDVRNAGACVVPGACLP